MAAEFIYFPFDDGPGSDSLEDRWRILGQYWRTTGILAVGNEMGPTDNCAVLADTGLQLLIMPGQAFLQSHMFIHEGDPWPMVISENNSGNPRFDLVVIRCDFEENLIEYAVIEGIPDENPVVPDPVASDIIRDLPLAIVLVEDGATQITNAEIQDVRVHSSQATFTSQCIAKKSTSTSVSDSAMVNIEYDTEILNPLHMLSTSLHPDRIYVKERGVYNVTFNATWQSSNTATGIVSAVVSYVRNGTPTAITTATLYANAGSANPTISMSCSGVVQLFPEDYVFVQVINNAGQPLDVVAGETSQTLSVIKITDPLPIVPNHVVNVLTPMDGNEDEE